MSYVPSRRLARTDDGWIAGVCAGIAHRYGMKPITVRALFLISCILPGPQFVVYIALWLLIPRQSAW